MVGLFNFKERKRRAKLVTEFRREESELDFEAKMNRRRVAKIALREEQELVGIKRAKERARGPSVGSRLLSGLDKLSRPRPRAAPVRRRSSILGKSRKKKKRRTTNDIGKRISDIYGF